MNGTWDDEDDSFTFKTLREGGAESAWAPKAYLKPWNDGFMFDLGLKDTRLGGTTFSRSRTRTGALLTVYPTREEARDAAVAEVQRLAMLGHFVEAAS